MDEKTAQLKLFGVSKIKIYFRFRTIIIYGIQTFGIYGYWVTKALNKAWHF